MYKAFNDQRKRARRRSIGFTFSYAEWCDWWLKNLGPEWTKLRGCRRGQYVMARYNDVGPYDVANVKCILHTDNIKERNQRLPKKGTQNACAKITEEQAKFIKHSRIPSRKLAAKFKLHNSTIIQIKNGRLWAHLK